MSNKISGKIIAALPEQGGTSKSGTAWRKREYVLETLEEKYPKKIAFQVMNAKIDEFGFAVGQIVEIEFDIESREFNGRWYTNVNAWKGEVKTAAAPQAAPQPTPMQAAQAMYGAPTPKAPQPTPPVDDLPF